MVLDRKKDDLASSQQVENQVIIEDKFPQIIAFSQETLQPIDQGLRLKGENWMGKERAPGLRKPAKSGHNVIENASHELLKGIGSIWFEEEAGRLQIVYEIFGEDGLPCPSGHTGLLASEEKRFSRSSDPRGRERPPQGV